MCRSVRCTFEEAVQTQLTLVETECRQGRSRWKEVKILPTRIKFQLSSCAGQPEEFDGEIDGYTYRAIPRVDAQASCVVYEVEVQL